MLDLPNLSEFNQLTNWWDKRFNKDFGNSHEPDRTGGKEKKKKKTQVGRKWVGTEIVQVEEILAKEIILPNQNRSFCFSFGFNSFLVFRKKQLGLLANSKNSVSFFNFYSALKFRANANRFVSRTVKSRLMSEYFTWYI